MASSGYYPRGSKGEVDDGLFCIYGAASQDSIDNIDKKHAQLCVQCLKGYARLYACSRCEVACYCSAECQRLDYKKHGHREICEALKKDRLASAGTLTSAIPINSTNELNQDVIRDWALQQLPNLYILAWATCNHEPSIAAHYHTYVGLNIRNLSSGRRSIVINYCYRVHYTRDPAAFKDDYAPSRGSELRRKIDRDTTVHRLFLSADVGGQSAYHAFQLPIARLALFALPDDLSIQKMIALMNGGQLISLSHLIATFNESSLSSVYGIVQQQIKSNPCVQS